jgi:hypothetical protein
MRPVSNEKREVIVEAKNAARAKKHCKMANDRMQHRLPNWCSTKKTGSIQPKPYKGNNHKITATQDTKI